MFAVFFSFLLCVMAVDYEIIELIKVYHICPERERERDLGSVHVLRRSVCVNDINIME